MMLWGFMSSDVRLTGQIFDDDELMLNVLRCQLTYYGQVVTNAEAWFNKSLRPQKPKGSLGRTAQDVHLNSHTAPELWQIFGNTICIYMSSRKSTVSGVYKPDAHISSQK